MANNTTTFTLKLKTEGLDQAQQQTQVIRENLEGAQRASSGTAGSRRFVSSGSARGTGMAGQSAGVLQGEDVDAYNRLRGAAGASGARGRDFSDQARGLGGLVRLYATFAANVFAATAALGALSNAMDTTNMVKGLDQLGAASGRSLGTLSKRLVEATDGAVSLREAMEATAKSSAAGLTNRQILELGSVAKQASLALGVNMTDALSRLSRGISKIEPELLDELGIYVKIDDAAQKYARTLGKTTISLTDFEKRQAFAVAVLEQAKDKFSAIEIDANPYNKLNATFQNVVQTGLELVNKVLGPIAKLLGESPVALAAAVGLIAKSLFSQALPAIGQWRDGIKKAAEEANQAVIRADAARKAMRRTIDSAIGDKIATAEIQSSQALEQKVNETLQNRLTKKTAGVLSAITPKTEDLKAVEDQTKAVNRQISALEKRTYTTERGKQANALEIAALKETKMLLEQKTLTLKAYNDTLNAMPVNKSGLGYYFSREAANERRLASAVGRQQRTSVLADTAQAYDVSGVRDAWTVMNQKIKEFRTVGDDSGKKMTALNAGFTRLSGVATIAAGAIGSVASALNIWAIGAALAVGAFELLDSILSKNAKQQEETKKSFELLKEAGDNLDRTLDNISRKKPLDQISTESIKARANAFGELAVAIEDTFKKIEKQASTAGGWDKFIDGWKSVVGKDLLSTSAKEMAFEVTKAIKGAGKESALLVQNLNKVTGVDVRRKGALEDVLGKDPEKFFELLPKIQEQLDQTKKKLDSTAGAAEQVDNSFKEASKTFDSILVAGIPTDPLAKLGMETIKVSQAMQTGFKDSEIALSNLAKTSADITRLRLFNPETATFLLNNSKRISELAEKQQIYSGALKDNLAIEKELEAVINYRYSDLVEVAAARKQLEITRDAIKRLREVQVPITQELKQYETIFKKGVDEAFINGAKQIEVSIGLGFQRAALVVRGAYASRLGDTSAGIQEEASIKKEEIRIQLLQIDSQISLIESNENLRAVQEKIYLQRLKEEQKTPEEKVKTQSLIDAIASGQDRYKGPKGFQALKADLSSSDEATRLAAQGASTSVFSRYGLQAKRTEILAGSKVADITAETRQIERQTAERSRQLDLELSRLNLEKKTQEFGNSQLQYLSEETLIQRELLEYGILLKQQEKDRLSIIEQIAKNEATLRPGSGASDESKKRAAQAILELQGRLGVLAQKQAVDRKAQDQDFLQKRLENEKKVFDYSLTLSKQLFDVNYQQQQTGLEKRKLAMDLEEKQGILDPISKIRLEADLFADQERLRSKQTLFNLEQEQQRKNYQFGIELANATTEQDKADIIKRLDASNSYYNALRNNETTLTALKVKNNEESSKINAILQETAQITQTLTGVFGDFGKSLGDVITSFVQIGIRQDAYNKKLADLQARKDSLQETDEQYSIVQQEIAKTQKDKTKAEVQDISTVAGKTKMLFKEKTAAYKAFAAVEKAGQALSLALEFEKFAVKIGLMESEVIATTLAEAKKTVAVEAGFFARAGTYITEIFAKFTSMLGPYGPPLAAAAIAAIGLAAFGKNKTVSTVGMTAQDRQETQGTGMTWVNGQKVATGGGVFGDSEAKSNSIRNSLEVISATSVEGLTYQDKTVKLLASINAGITGVAQNAYGVVGLRTGSAFGTQEGSGGRMVLGGLFGGTTSTQILDTGIALKGTFDQLAKGGKDLVQIYETVKTSSTSSFLWVKKTNESLNTNIKNADSKIAEGITEVFSNAASLFVENGVKLGMTAEQVFAKLAQISTDQLISLKDLKGDELEKELNAVISSILDTAATSVFESLKQYQKFGEGMLETAVRVIDSNQKVNLALKSTSMVLLNIGEVLTEGSIKASEALVAAAGGLDKFLEQSKFFADNFLTEAERLAPVQADLTKRLVALGLGTVDTKDKFKLLVQGLDLAKEADQALYQSLMELAPAFNMVYKESQQLLSVEELKSKVYDQETKVLELLGKKQELLARARAKELDEMRKYPKQQADILIANQEYIYALEDEATARENLKKRVDDTISGLKTAIQNITQYRTQLTMSDKTVLTPAEQYKQAQEEFEKLKTTAVGPAATEADRALQLEAINKLPQAADTFLNLSRTMYASGSQYQTDFASVLSTLDTVGVNAQTQLTTAEQQLTELKQSSYYLEDIALSSKSTKELLEEWRNAADRAQTASSGFTPVNMLVNTVSPNADVVQEVAKLREEFTKQFEKLREEQAQQAAAAIVNNTVVNDNVANKIIDALEQDSGSTWNDRVTSDGP